MKDLIGIAAIMFIGGIWYLMSLPSVEDERALWTAHCPGSHTVIVNGIIAGCVDDKQTVANTYRPPHDYKDIPLVRIREYDDSWMDGP
jgi:hypothetical protein